MFVLEFVEGKDELLTSKLNSLLKHFVHGKCKVSMQSVDVCTLYLNKNFVYAKNELKYTIFECPFVLNYFQVDGPLQKIKKMSNCFLSMTCLPMDIQL
jgi:hypothetical protein